MLSLMPHLRKHFDSLTDRLDCFCSQGVQLEGWFKGELLYILHRLRAEGVVSNFDREVRTEVGCIDFAISQAEICNWVELKFWLIGQQKGTRYGPGFYFGDRATVGICNDVSKLRALSCDSHRWILILAVERPSDDAWQNGIAKHNEKFNADLIAHTSPADFPPSYFLGLLEVG